MAAEEHTKTPLRFGIMCNGWELYAWQAKAIRLLEEKGCLPSLLIINDEPVRIPGVWTKLRHYPFRNLFYRFFLRYCHHPKAKRTVNVMEEMKHIPAVKCRTIKRSHSQYFTDADVNSIKAHQLDFILRFGFNIIRGDILDAAQYGIWSFHHGDEQQFRGGPPGFWEICRKTPVTGAILQRLTGRLDAGIVLRKGYFRTIRHSWSETIDQLFTETAHWPAQVATDIMNGVNLSWKDAPSNTAAPVYKNPGNIRMVRFALNLTLSRILFHWNNFTRAEKWNIGLVEVPPGNFLERPAGKTPVWIHSPRPHQYQADPFAISLPNELIIFYESFDYKTGKGNISFVTVDPVSGRSSQPTIALEKDYHLAYPFTLESDGVRYCVPESAQNHTIDLYRWDGESQTLVHVKTLIGNVDAVDSTLFRYEGKWWLFCTDKANSGTHLYAWYADKLTGPYKPHHNNPIKTDIRSARPAGKPFIANGFMYRPAQDCSLSYGGSISIQQIIRLSPYEFEERHVQTIEPFKESEFPHGIHTLADAGRYTVLDAKKYVFDRYHFVRQLNMRIHKRISKKSDHWR
ncbi:MAG: hypothetical protein PHD25_07715 [Bacteroidales bacterium]|nr:hypothetical protein [Bacteroidales bacterium]